jgi:hypothetical protein
MKAIYRGNDEWYLTKNKMYDVVEFEDDNGSLKIKDDWGNWLVIASGEDKLNVPHKGIHEFELIGDSKIKGGKIMNRWKEFAEMLDVPFNTPFKVVESKEWLIINEVGIGYWDEKGGFDEDIVLSYQLLDGKLNPLTLEGKEFWVLNPYSEKGYYSGRFYKEGTKGDYAAYSRKMLFLTEEEAKQRIKELGW